jgi:hypothetical protein
VTVIALASIKGSPGVTTAATALAASWPTGRRVLLVEADPFGGDLAPRYGSTITNGLASLFAAARRTLTPEGIWDHVDHLPGGLPVLFGHSNVQGAVANEKAWPAIAEALGALDADVVVDAGRLLPHFAGGIRDVLAHSDVLVVLCDPTLEGIVHLRAALPSLVAEMSTRALLVVPTGSGGYSGTEIGKTLGVDVGPPMPDDRKAADALANKRAITRLERTALLKWASALVGALGIEALNVEPLGIEEPAPVVEDGDPTDLIDPAVPEESAVVPPPVDVETPTMSWDQTSDSAVPVGAGSNGKAQR